MKKEHFEILLEQMNSKFDVVLEGHEALRGEIRELARRTNERFDLVDFKIDTLNKKIDSVEARLDKKIDSVEEKLSKRIDSVEAKLSKRIDEAEESLSARLDAVSADLSAHRADTEVHRGSYRVMEE